MGFEGDEELLDGLRKISGKIFRIDANGGWTPERAERMIFYLGRLEVEVIEQPTGLKYIRDWKYLRSGSSGKVPIFIDEGLNTLEDYEAYCDWIDGINIKMPKSGGLIEAVDIARRAKKDKRYVMLGCMIESSIGIAPLVFMSALADYFDLDSPLLLKEDPGEGLHYKNEILNIDEKLITPRPKHELIENANDTD
jgi:L-alanine-DL-glutamate epimerase-like enolase superfamily enzyme